VTGVERGCWAGTGTAESERATRAAVAMGVARRKEEVTGRPFCGAESRG
jgi:hypothetical protein